MALVSLVPHPKRHPLVLAERTSILELVFLTRLDDHNAVIARVLAVEDVSCGAT